MVSRPRRGSQRPSEENLEEVTPTPPTFQAPEDVEKVSEEAEVVEQDVSDESQPDLDDEEAQIAAALKRKTHDGKGEDPVPPENFESFATEGVEKKTKSLQVLTQEVLDGKWGDHAVRRQRLEDAGHNPTEIQKLVNMRLAGGAPSSHRATIGELRDQIERLEWGASDKEVSNNLARAGYSLVDIKALLPHYKG